MTIEHPGRLGRKLQALKGKARGHVTRAIARNTREGARVAKVLAPNVTGETREGITTRFTDEGMTGIVEVIDPKAPRAEKDRAYSIEHGRKEGDHGTTEGYEFVRRTRQFLGTKHKRSIKAAINRAAKEASKSA